MSINSRSDILIVTVALACCTFPVNAAPPTRGEVLAAACAQCHGTEGRAVSSWPSIAGKSASGMYKNLLERKYRKPEGIMDMQARGYTNEQLFLIAQFYGSLSGRNND